jgi:hypothetical protein
MGFIIGSETDLGHFIPGRFTGSATKCRTGTATNPSQSSLRRVQDLP